MKRWKRCELYSGDYVYSKHSLEYRMLVLSIINNMVRCLYLDVETSTIQTFNIRYPTRKRIFKMETT